MEEIDEKEAKEKKTILRHVQAAQNVLGVPLEAKGNGCNEAV